MALYTPRKFELDADYCVRRDDKRHIRPYIFPETAVIAVDVALATNRPLLIAGPPGCGKSRLAEAMANVLGWHFLSKTITSRTRLEELTVEVDHLRRLHDAHRAASLKPDQAYHNPGIFWWAFDRESAARRGLSAADAALPFPGRDGASAGEHHHTVLLIDEIDKAEPDVPNDLLEPLDRSSFCLPDGTTLHANPEQQLLTVITTNRERELPQAFLRRCVSLVLGEPKRDTLLAIGNAHFGDECRTLIEVLADKLIKIHEASSTSGRRPPGTSEFLDAIRTCKELSIDVADTKLWSQIERAVLVKPTV
ncbi:MAG: dynein-related subfamily AAA family protein [Candidatus Accumulibacter regalis]|jgi:MoxR-like ATPase|uniref:AAA family ATPase n=1 Tax=Candidatus Accumulibacter sp. ACC005 TaxID=2823331 RepID=UPI0025C2CE38|nr:MoxR family ATPase [Candidatus Accumulibacter sp. ACC005]